MLGRGKTKRSPLSCPGSFLYGILLALWVPQPSRLFRGLLLLPRPSGSFSHVAPCIFTYLCHSQSFYLWCSLCWQSGIPLNCHVRVTRYGNWTLAMLSTGSCAKGESSQSASLNLQGWGNLLLESHKFGARYFLYNVPVLTSSSYNLYQMALQDDTRRDLGLDVPVATSMQK